MSEDAYMRAQIAYLDRRIEESHRFTAEQRRLMADARRLDRPGPWMAAVALLGGALGFAAFIASLLR